MNKLVVLATVCLIGAHGEPDPQEYEREVNSLNSLQQQPKPSFLDRIYGGAQGFANPYMRNNYGQPQQPTYGPSQPPNQPTYGNLNPYPYYPQMPQMPPSWGYPSVPGGSSGYYPSVPGGSTGYYPNYPSYPESSTSKPNYGETEYDDEEDDDNDSDTGVEIVDNNNSGNMNGNLNWQNPNMNWNQGGINWGQPSWSQSYTPVGGGCYNRCQPKCSFRPPPPPPPRPQPLPPRPRPIPMPRPQPMPLPAPRPSYGCRTSCRPTCNLKPSCGGGAQMNGNTMMCSSRPNYNQGARPNYNQGYGMYGNYGNYNSMYPGGMMNTLPAVAQAPKQASKTVEEAPVVNEENVEGSGSR